MESPTASGSPETALPGKYSNVSSDIEDSVKEPQAPKRHSEFYFRDGNTVLLVENTLFNLHRSFLCREDDNVFHSMLSMPQDASESPQGSSDEHPIHLPEVDANVFTLWVRVLYAVAVGGSAPLKKQSWRSFDWRDVMRLADKLCVESVIQDVAKSITSLPLDNTTCALYLQLAIELNGAFTETYRTSLFRRLIQRQDPLTEKEAELLRWQLRARIATHRENAFFHYVKNSGVHSSKIIRQALNSLPSECMEASVEDLI